MPWLRLGMCLMLLPGWGAFSFRTAHCARPNANGIPDSRPSPPVTSVIGCFCGRTFPTSFVALMAELRWLWGAGGKRVTSRLRVCLHFNFGIHGCHCRRQQSSGWKQCAPLLHALSSLHLSGPSHTYTPPSKHPRVTAPDLAISQPTPRLAPRTSSRRV